MPSALIKRVADYCWSNNFLSVFHKFFADHAEAFIGAPEICGGEHNMEYYSLFQLYLGVYEDTLTEYVQTLECSIEEFYREVREAQDETTDPYLKTFIECLLASADYESFYKVMVREGKKKSLALKKAALKSESGEDKAASSSSSIGDEKSAAATGPSSPSTAEGKGSRDEEADWKGSGGGGGSSGYDASDAKGGGDRDEGDSKGDSK